VTARGSFRITKGSVGAFPKAAWGRGNEYRKEIPVQLDVSTSAIVSLLTFFKNVLMPFALPIELELTPAVGLSL